MICPGRHRHMVLRLWVMLVLVSLSSIAWSKGTDSTPHSLIQHPPETSPTRKLALVPGQTQSSPQPVVPHTLIKKPTPPSPPITPVSAVPSVSSPQLGASASSMSQPVPTGIAPASDPRPSPDISMGRTAPLASAAVSPRKESPRLPSALQRLFRDNPAFIKLLQVQSPC